MQLKDLSPGDSFRYRGLGDPPAPSTLPTHLLIELDGPRASVVNTTTGVTYWTHASGEIEDGDELKRP